MEHPRPIERPFEAKPPAPSLAPHVQSDIPMEILDGLYIPASMSSKSSLRSDGADHQNDQEAVDDIAIQWNQEDVYTNKSGDPNIGTHHRSNRQEARRDESRPR